MSKEIRIPKAVIKKYLEEKERKPVKVIDHRRLGSGWHGTGYIVKYEIRNTKSERKTKEIVIRTLMPENFSHDFVSDRAKVFILQHEMARRIPGHIESFDVSGFTGSGKLVSLGDVREFFQVVKVAKGISYSADFQRIKGSGKLLPIDRQRAKLISDQLVKLHSEKFKGTKDSARSIKRRHTRDAIGHGEMMMGVIDTYPDGYKFITREKLTELVCGAVRYREKVKDLGFKLCRIHGDFHPGNIMFNGNKITVLDASRELWGDPADDVVAMALNYIWFAVMQTGGFNGPFSELFRIFWDNYFSKTKDKFIKRTAGVHMAFRGVVVAHPVFYSAQSDTVRRKMLGMVSKVLKSGSFDPNKIDQYVR